MWHLKTGYGILTLICIIYKQIKFSFILSRLKENLNI